MEYSLVIPGYLPGWNQYISAERSSRYKGAQMKADSEKLVIRSIKKCLGDLRIKKPVEMEYHWIEKNRRRDKDNVSGFGRKVIQDALVHSGTLENDGWKEIIGFSDRFSVDEKNPRIEVLIKEV